MKKLLIALASISMLSTFKASTSQVNEIQGMPITYDLIEYNNNSSTKGTIEDDYINIFVVTGSSDYLPSLANLEKNNKTLCINIELKNNSDVISFTMAYWKITIKSNELYLKDVENISIKIN